MNHGSEQYQLLPALAADDFERLKSDIAERGVLVPIEVDESGNVLDGHHRKRIADELGIDCPTVTRIGMAEHEKRLHAVALNLARRHLTDAQKVALGMTIEPDVAEEARRRQGTLPLRCHYLAYIYKSDACGLLISFHLMQRALATHYDEWRAKATARRDGFRWVEARNTSYVTVSIAVPTDVLLAAMNEEVGFGLAEAA